MAFDVSIILKLEDKISKNLQKVNKQLILIEKTAKKSTKKINKHLKGLKLKQKFVLNIKKALKSLRTLKEKIKDIGRTLKNKIKMPKLSGFAKMATAVGGAFGVSKFINTGLNREIADKLVRKVMPDSLNTKQLAFMESAANADGSNRKFPNLGTYMETMKVFEALFKMGASFDQMKVMYKDIMVAGSAWQFPAEDFIKVLGEILLAFKVKDKDMAEQTAILGNHVDFLGDKLKAYDHKKVIDVMLRNSTSLKDLGFSMKKSISVSSWVSLLGGSSEIAAQGFQSFYGDLISKLTPGKLEGLDPNYVSYLQSATTGDERVGRLKEIIDQLHLLSNTDLFELFSEPAVKFLMKARGNTDKLLKINDMTNDRKAMLKLAETFRIDQSGLSAKIANFKKAAENLLAKIYDLLEGPLSTAVELLTKGLAWLTRNPTILRTILQAILGIASAVGAHAIVSKIGGLFKGKGEGSMSKFTGSKEFKNIRMRRFFKLLGYAGEAALVASFIFPEKTKAIFDKLQKTFKDIEEKGVLSTAVDVAKGASEEITKARKYAKNAIINLLKKGWKKIGFGGGEKDGPPLKTGAKPGGEETTIETKEGMKNLVSALNNNSEITRENTETVETNPLSNQYA